MDIYRDYRIESLGQLTQLRDMHARKGTEGEPARVNAILKVLTAHSRATGAGDEESARGLHLRLRVYGEGHQETMYIVKLKSPKGGADKLLKVNRNAVRSAIRAGALSLAEVEQE